MKTIGIVCEGPRDYDMLTQIIMRFMNEEYRFLPIQPDQDICTSLGAGWKGVLRWCTENKDSLADYLSGIEPQIDLLIIQMDGDVSRCEREVYCRAVNIACPGQTHEDPLNCSIAKMGGCNQILPPNSVCDGSVQGRVRFIESLILSSLGRTESAPLVIVIPCDSTDTWIIAACDEKITHPEEVNSPWDDVISRGKDYFGVRIPGHRKSHHVYSFLVSKVCDNWENVKKRCPQSCRFECSVKSILTH